MAHEEDELRPEFRWPVATPVFIVLATLGLLLFTVNLKSTWESDQSAKAAQILEIVDANDYFLSSHLPNYYRLAQMPLFFFFSSLGYKVVGGSIIAFMNLTSVVLGTLTILSVCYALRNALAIHPFWTALVLLAMPLVVINSTYGNEAAFSMFFLALAMFLGTCRNPWLYYGSGVAFACSAFSRVDMMALMPYCGLWCLMFGPPYASRGEFYKRAIKLGAVLAVSLVVIWLAVVRANFLDLPKMTDWETRLMLVVGYLSFPFNPSVILLGAIGWLVLCRQRWIYAATHLLLVLPVVYYLGSLSSPKYVIMLALFYGIPAAYLLARSGRVIRTVGVAVIFVWFVVGVSNFGVFGPRSAALFYLPTMDGPIPIGGYANFYNLAHQGFYQAKQDEMVQVAGSLLGTFDSVGPDVRLAGDIPGIGFPINRVDRRRRGLDPNVKQPANATTGDSQFLTTRWGVIGVDRSSDEQKQKVLDYLAKGQLRPLVWREGEAFPEVVEFGPQVPEGTNVELGKRFLFMHDYYHGYRAYHLPKFIESYAATSWLPRPQIMGSELPKPIYEDEHFMGFDRDVPGAEVYGLQWPSRYHQFERVKPKLDGG